MGERASGRASETVDGRAGRRANDGRASGRASGREGRWVAGVRAGEPAAERVDGRARERAGGWVDERWGRSAGGRAGHFDIR